MSFGKQLVEAGVCKEADLAAIREKVAGDMLRNMKLAIDETVSPRIDIFGAEQNFIGDLMFSNQTVRSMDESRPSDMLLPKAECPRVQQIAKKHRFYLDDNGKPVPKARVYQYRDAIAEPIINKYYEDPTGLLWRGCAGLGRRLCRLPGHDRGHPLLPPVQQPHRRGAIVGAAVGYGMSGGRAVAELMYCDFLGRAGDEVFNQLSKWQAMSAGMLKMPVVLRMSVGSKYGAQHSQDWSACAPISPALRWYSPPPPTTPRA